jgi:ATP-binding cassette subfamily B protein
LALVRPYRLRVVAMVLALVLGTAAALAPPLLARLAIDQGITRHDGKVLLISCSPS